MTVARRRTSKRNMTVELVERGEVLNLRLIGEAVAQSMRRRSNQDIKE